MTDLSNIEELIDNEVELTAEQQIEIYGYEALEGIPTPEMDKWTLGFHPSEFSEKYGRYVLVEVQPAGIEMHHQVLVLDESGVPLRGVWVVFGFDTGRALNDRAEKIAWVNHPQDPRGNPQKSDAMGYAQHTFGSGGEDIWVWDVQADGLLELPSWIIKNCTWVAAPVAGAWSLHTGVKLIFQRRREDVEPRGPRLDRLDNALKALESKIEALQSGQDLAVHLDSIRGDLKSLKETQNLALENLKLRVELLEVKVASLIS